MSSCDYDDIKNPGVYGKDANFQQADETVFIAISKYSLQKYFVNAEKGLYAILLKSTERRLKFVRPF